VTLMGKKIRGKGTTIKLNKDLNREMLNVLKRILSNVDVLLF
jgi:hypothetical protein